MESYDANGLLSSIEQARTGSSITVQRDARRRIARVSDNVGREINFTYVSATSPQIASLTLPDGTSIAYGYNGEALQTVTYADQTTRGYEYYPPSTENQTLLNRVLHNGTEYTYYEYGATAAFTDGVRRLATKSRLTGANADYTFAYTLNPLGHRKLDSRNDAARCERHTS